MWVVLRPGRGKRVLKVNAVVYRTNDGSLAFLREIGYEDDDRSLAHGKILK